MMTTYYATRFHTKPDNDEHAAMCHVDIYAGEDWQEAKNAVIAYLAQAIRSHTERGNTVRKSGITVTDSYDKLIADESAALHTTVRWDVDDPDDAPKDHGWQAWIADAGDVRYRITGPQHHGA